jgi:ribonuclease VapC
MVIDSSALVSIFLQEPDAGHFATCIAEQHTPVMSAASLLETSIVMRGRKRMDTVGTERWIDDFIAVGQIRIMPVTLEQMVAARLAHRQFGKGTGHPAALNFGDCFSYALAKTMRVPLLFKGNDFARTDIEPALG